MATEMTYVFAYDVSRPGPRRRIAARLERAGTRVQGSVFEVRATQARAERLLEALATLRGPGDSVRMYCLTEDGRQRCRASGGPPPPESGGYWLL